MRGRPVYSRPDHEAEASQMALDMFSIPATEQNPNEHQPDGAAPLDSTATKYDNKSNLERRTILMLITLGLVAGVVNGK